MRFRYSLLLLAVFVGAVPLFSGAGARSTVAQGVVQQAIFLPYVVNVGETLVDLQWEWGDISLAPGSRGIQVTDWDRDGTNEVLVANGSFVAALRDVSNYRFSQVWAASMGVAWGLANLDSDPAQELWVLQPDGRLLAYDPFSYTPQRLGSIGSPDINLSNGSPFVAATITDLLKTEQQELLVLVNENDHRSLRTYSLAGLRQTWSYSIERAHPAYYSSRVIVAQVDDDPALEIILDDGIVIDRGQSVEQWFYSPGFGSQMVAADLDSDGRDELIGNANRLTVFDIDLHTPSYELPGNFNRIEALYTGDVTGDGVPDIIGGEDQWGFLRLWNGATRQPLWNVDKVDAGTCGIGLGDANGDGVMDLVWCAGSGSSAPDHLYLTPIDHFTATFTSRDLDGPYAPIPMQLDSDDALELVIFTYASDSGYGGPTYVVVDSATGREEFDLHIDVDIPTSGYQGTALTSLLVNLDSDPYQEVILGIGSNLYLLDHDGRRLLKTAFSTPVTPVWVGDVDGDGNRELVSYSGSRVNIHRLDTLEYTWQSAVFTEGVRDLAVADLDNDAHLDLLFHGANSTLQAYDAQTHQLKWQGPPTQHVAALAVGNVDGVGDLEIVTVEDDYLTFYDAATHSLLRRTVYVPRLFYPHPLTLAHVMDTPYPQLIVHVNRTGVATDSELWLFKHPYDNQPAQTLRVYPWSMTLADTDGDHHMDLLVGHIFGARRYRFRDTLRATNR